MSPIQPSLAILIFILGKSPLLLAQGTQHHPPSGRVQLAINTDEAEAVLAILDKHNARAPITERAGSEKLAFMASDAAAKDRRAAGRIILGFPKPAIA